MSIPKLFDVIVIGGGPGGYPAAIKAAQHGASVALIEETNLGGTCLNRGCIPSKTLIAGAEVLRQVTHAERFGITLQNVGVNFQKMKERKDDIVFKIRRSLEGLIQANQIVVFKGRGKLISSQQVKVQGESSAILEGKKIIIATGSEPKQIPSLPFDYTRIHDSTSFLNVETLPTSLIIIGGGVIGCEFASLYATLGVNVTILEALPRILSTECESVSTFMKKSLENQGIKIITKAIVEKIQNTGKEVLVSLEGGKALRADIALVAIGRKLNTDNIGLEQAGVYSNERGMIPTNERMETNIPGIYAVGDITGKWMLAHVATHQGIIAASNATGQETTIHYNAIPSVIFTYPEVGSCGLTLKQALDTGYQATLHAFPFQALGKSQATAHTEGFAQLVVDKKTGQVLGAQVIGQEAATLISEMSIVIANELTVDCIAETIHAHPTIAEAWMEAAQLAMGAPLHLPPKNLKRSI